VHHRAEVVVRDMRIRVPGLQTQRVRHSRPAIQSDNEMSSTGIRASRRPTIRDDFNARRFIAAMRALWERTVAIRPSGRTSSPLGWASTYQSPSKGTVVPPTRGCGHHDLRLIGGASFPGKVGTISATWPLAVLTSDDDGVTVDLRARLLKVVLGRFMGRDRDSVWWSAEWDQIESVDFGRRSVILRSSVQRGCRFVTMSRRQLQPFVTDLDRRNIVVKRKASTLGWFMKPT